MDELGVRSWPTRSADELEFPWHHDDRETCDFLEGDVVVTPDSGDPVEMGVGKLVTFPQGMSCMWKIRSRVLKHYRLGDS